MHPIIFVQKRETQDQTDVQLIKRVVEYAEYA